MWLGIAIAVGLIVWAVGGLLALNPLPWQIRKYWDAPGAKELRIIQAIALLLIIAGVTVFFVTEPGTFWHDLWPEMISTGGAVLGIDELNRRRSAQEYKRSIIRQMRSRANDFALDAARIARDEQWLDDGSLEGANLREANLSDAILRYARLTEVNLLGSNLTGANLQGSNLAAANLFGANFTRAILRSGNLTKANLGEANFTEAQLEAANFVSADLQYTNFEGANLREANFTEANLQNVNLAGALFDSDTSASSTLKIQVL